jgi:hypothetical protein
MNQALYAFANLLCWWFYFQFKPDLELSSETLGMPCQDLSILVAVVLLLFRFAVDERHLWVSVGCGEPTDNSSVFW